MGRDLYAHALDIQMAPLIWTSMAFTLAALLLVPFLPRVGGTTPCGEKAGGA